MMRYFNLLGLDKSGRIGEAADNSHYTLLSHQEREFSNNT